MPNDQRTTTVNGEGLSLIKSFEACKLTAYQDSVGIWTIGWGNTQYENGTSVKKGDVITQDRADELFKSILSRFESGVDRRLTARVSSNQFAALVAFTYNVGFGNFDKSTLLKKVNANPNDASIKDEFLKWNKAGGQVLKGLTRRRTAESQLYFK